MQTFIQRSVWSLVWAAVIAIALWLNLDMAREQPILFALVAVCLFVTSVALVFTRSNYRNGNYGEAFAALLVGAFCLGVTIISEVSFWSSSIEGVHDQIAREKAKTQGVDLVQEKRREQLRLQTSGKSPKAIEAEMLAALTKVYRGQTLASLTADCGDTSSQFYRYCADFFSLKAQLASANELKELEGKVLADSTQVVVTTVKRSFYKAAQIGSEQIGGSVQAWVAGIVVWMVLTMTALHLAALYVAFAPGRRTEARTAPKASEGTGGAAKPVSPVTETQRIVEMMRETGLTKYTAYDPDSGMWRHVEANKLDPSPTGGKPDPIKERPDLARKADNPPSPEVGQPTEQSVAEAAKEHAIIHQVSPVRLAVNNDSFEEIEPRPQPKSKKKQVKRAEGSVVRWLDACTTQTPDKRVKATSRECRRSYIAFCEMEGTHPVGHKQQSRMMSAALRKGDHGRGPRNGDGAVWLGLIVMQPSANPLRRRA